MKGLTKDQFELAYRRLCDHEGTSCDPWDIGWAWLEYQRGSLDDTTLKALEHFV